MKHLPIIAVIIIIVLLGYIFLLSKSSNGSEQISSNPNSLLYFWSVTCPHCKNVEDFLTNWENKDKIVLEKFEISKNENNQKLFIQKSAECKIPQTQIATPLLTTPDGKCLSGDIPIIDYLKSLFPESSGSATISATPSI